MYFSYNYASNLIKMKPFKTAQRELGHLLTCQPDIFYKGIEYLTMSYNFLHKTYFFNITDVFHATFTLLKKK